MTYLYGGEKPPSRFARVPALVKLIIFAAIILITGILRSQLFRLITSAPMTRLYERILIALTGRSAYRAHVDILAALYSPLFSLIINAAFTLLLGVLPFILIAKQDPGSVRAAFRTDGRVTPYLAPLYCVMQSASGTTSTIAAFIIVMLLGNDALPAAESYDSYGAAALIGLFLELCVLAPLAEELMFRGVIFTSLRRHGLPIAVVGSAFLFAVAHGSPIQIAYAFVSGIVLSLAYEYTHDIRNTVLLHAINNAFQFLLGTLLPRLLPGSRILFAEIPYQIAVSVGAMIGTVFLIRRMIVLNRIRFAQSERRF